MVTGFSHGDSRARYNLTEPIPLQVEQNDRGEISDIPSLPSGESWQQALDQYSWCSSVRKARHKFKERRHEAAKGKHRGHREQAASQSSSAKTFIYPQCSRVCASQIRLYSHQQACKNKPPTLPKSLSARTQPLLNSLPMI